MWTYVSIPAGPPLPMCPPIALNGEGEDHTPLSGTATSAREKGKRHGDELEVDDAERLA